MHPTTKQFTGYNSETIMQILFLDSSEITGIPSTTFQKESR